MRMRNMFITAAVCVAAITVFSACKKDNCADPQVATSSGVEMKKQSQVYPLASVTDSTISGSVTFQKAGVNTLVTIQLDGTSVGDSHPAHIHFNNVATGGGIAVSLTPVNGGSGRSVTIVKQMDNGTPISYDSLLNFNGHVNVHLSDSALNVLIAQGDIGSNF